MYNMNDCLSVAEIEADCDLDLRKRRKAFDLGHLPDCCGLNVIHTVYMDVLKYNH